MEIDLVYTWVDDKDPAWAKRKAEFDESAKDCNKDAISICRFFNNDELKYSLRSAEKNIPWIRKIFIITDNQTPDWLDTNNDRIKIVDHKEILPNDKLPLYNAAAIENGISEIKELSEFFIYTNDDMFFWNKMEPEFFFEGEKPICRLGSKIKKNKEYKHLYGAMIYRAYSLVKEKFGVEVPYFPHHNADSYRKSLFKECKEVFKEQFDATTNNRFRDFSDMQRSVISYYSIAKNEALAKNVALNFFEKLTGKTPDSEFISATMKKIPKIKNTKAKLLCINDTLKTTNEARKLVKEILDAKFPEKSSFEK